MTEDVKFTLSRAVTAYGEEVKELTFREPTGKEVRKIGSPLLFDAEGNPDFDMDRVGRYVEVLSTPPLPPSAVDKISAADWLPLAAAIVPFFVPSES